MSKEEQYGSDIESLIGTLASKIGAERQKARMTLENMGHEAVPSLCDALRKSRAKMVRWESAKALCAMRDPESIPFLVGALEDRDFDVAWLAAEALEKHGQVAWPELLHTLIKRGRDSVMLLEGAHHVLRKQRNESFDEALEVLVEALEFGKSSESVTVAAYKLLEKMGEKAE
ncbi:MAG: HEAT repeat domain-containing protein [Rectinemataceae bacterium]